MSAEALTRIEKRLRYRFRDRELLVRALTHGSSTVPGQESNERLEFLGDAVLGAVVASILFKDHTTLDEGKLTKVRAQVVSQSGLAAIAQDMRLVDEIIVGKCFERRETISDSVLADAVEALIAAVYLDGGFRSVVPLVRRLFRQKISTLAVAPGGRDWKSLLGQWAQRRSGRNPHYRLESSTGPDHARTFDVSVHVGNDELARGKGHSKKSAEQEAARIALAKVAAP